MALVEFRVWGLGLNLGIQEGQILLLKVVFCGEIWVHWQLTPGFWFELGFREASGFPVLFC